MLPAPGYGRHVNSLGTLLDESDRFQPGHMRHSIRSFIPQSPAIASIVVAVYLVLASSFIWYTEHTRLENERRHAVALGTEYAHAIQLNIEQALSSTYALAAMVQLSKGAVPEFETVANAMRAFFPGIAALQLAPDGIVRRIVPIEGNEKAIGHNLLVDPERDKEAFLARDTGKLTLAGPFPLIQGGLGAVGRLPVYLDDGHGSTRFWGFVTVLVRFPDVLEQARLSELAERGYQYEIWRKHPDTGSRHVIAASSANALHDPVEVSLQVPNATWTLSVAPEKGWIDRMALIGNVATALFILMLLVLAAWRSRRDNA